MSMQDPIADMFCRMMNIKARNRTEVSIPMSKEKVSILEVLKRCGYIDGYELHQAEDIKIEKPSITVTLRKSDGHYAMNKIVRISKPSRRKTVTKNDVPRVSGGMGIAILHTSIGVLSCHEARKANVGGEVICYVYS